MKKAHVTTAVVIVAAVGLGTAHLVQVETTKPPVKHVVTVTPALKPVYVAPVVVKTPTQAAQSVTTTKGGAVYLPATSTPSTAK